MRTSMFLMLLVAAAMFLASAPAAVAQETTTSQESTIIQLARTLQMDKMDIEEWAVIFILSSIFVGVSGFAVSRVIKATRQGSVPDDLYDQIAVLEQRVAELEGQNSAVAQGSDKPVEFHPVS